jgi:hypothetical protein
MAGVTKFELDLTKVIERTKQNLDQAVRKTVMDLGTSLVMKSPVGNPDMWQSPAPKGYTGGRFRANWEMHINQAGSERYEVVDASGGASLNRIAAALSSGKAGDTFYITNSLPYARKLEYEGHSKQVPPAGMVGQTLVEFDGIVAKAVESVKR